MRKVDNSTSQDGADTTSITSAIENEVKKASGLKAKRTSIKRKMPNFSHESDDTVIEPLLQSEREKSDNNRSAKFLISKSKTDSGNERSDNVFIESKVDKCSPTSTTPLSENIPYTNKVKQTPVPKVTAPIHNHMNTNVFGGLEVTKAVPPKSAVIVEIEKSRGSTYTPGPLIFTTAKIHTDNKTKQMEPVQVTPVPILSTIEGSVVKSVTGVIDSEKNRQELVKPKTDFQRKEPKECELKSIKPLSSTKDTSHPATLSSDIKTKTEVTSCKSNTITTPTTTTAVQLKPSQNLFEKSSVPKDSRTQIMPVEKVDIMNTPISTTTKSEAKTLQGESRVFNVDKTQKCVIEKSFGGLSSFESTGEKYAKIGNGKTPISSSDFKKLSPNGVSTFKLEAPSSKESAVTSSVSSDSKSNDNSKATGTFSTNKQLQRQKKATVEDISEPGIKTKSVDCDRVENSTSSKDNKVNISIKAVPENKVKSTMPSQSLSKTTVETRSVVSTTSAKPSTKISEKSSPVTSVSTVLPNIATSAKTPLTFTKNVVSDKDNSKSITKPAGDTSKSANVVKSLKKEISSDVKKGTDIQAVASQSSKMPESSKTATKPSSISKLETRVGSHVNDSHKIATPSVASSSTSSTGNKGLTSQALGSGKSSTSSVKSPVATTMPSSTSSAKTLIASNKKIEPLFNEHNKDSRA